MASHYGLRATNWGPVELDADGHASAMVTVEVSRLYRVILLLQVGLPMVEALPMRCWPRGMWILFRVLRGV